MILIISSIVWAVDSTEPEGPALTTQNTSRRNISDSAVRTAVAGNVTQINMVGSTITQTWQGYYGNISGQIRLDNAANQAMYSWNLPYPSGEVFASEIQSVNWTADNLRCWHFTENQTTPGTFLDLTEYETGSAAPVHSGLGLAAADVDGVDETFTNHTSGGTSAGHANFYVGTLFFNGSVTGAESYNDAALCPRTWIYNNSGMGGWSGTTYNTSRFEEVLLYGNIHGSATPVPIYTSIIEQYGALGFDGRSWNFQMIVAEDGHNGNTATTNYYFYVELE